MNYDRKIRHLDKKLAKLEELQSKRQRSRNVGNMTDQELDTTINIGAKFLREKSPKFLTTSWNNPTYQKAKKFATKARSLTATIGRNATN